MHMFDIHPISALCRLLTRVATPPSPIVARLGGMGCWELAAQAPQLFAGLAPVAAYHKEALRWQIAEACTWAELLDFPTCWPSTLSRNQSIPVHYVFL